MNFKSKDDSHAIPAKKDFWAAYRNLVLKAGAPEKTVQELLGHADVSTTMIYTHVLNKPGLAVKSPADL